MGVSDQGCLREVLASRPWCDPGRLEEFQKKFPVGSKVKTALYSREKDRVRIVEEVWPAPTRSQTGVFVRTECGVYADADWFELVGE